MSQEDARPNPGRYANMQYRRTGKSGLRLSALSLGLWHNFGHNDDLREAERMVWGAFDLGITHFDLANNYGPPPGSAEENFGRFLKSGLGRYRDELVVSSKAGYLMWEGPYGEWGTRKHVLSSLDQSLKRTGLDYVDIFYSHRFDPNTPLEETMGALDSAVRQGKAMYVGISSYGPEETTRAAKILADLGTPCIIHQPNYNMLDRWIEKGLIGVLEREGIGCIAFCPLAQGLLTNKYLAGIPSDSRAARANTALEQDAVSADIVEALNKLNGIAKERGQTLAQMAVTWVLRDPRLTSVLIGASRLSQIEENVKAVTEAAPLNAEEIGRIDKVLTPSVLASAKRLNLWVDY
jgi:L-glyceraldehyde 3-phosphate reductase